MNHTKCAVFTVTGSSRAALETAAWNIATTFFGVQQSQIDMLYEPASVKTTAPGGLPSVWEMTVEVKLK